MQIISYNCTTELFPSLAKPKFVGNDKGGTSGKIGHSEAKDLIMNPIEWFYAKGDKHSGPVNSNELKRMATTGELKPDDLVWREGMADWTIARNVRGLFEEENKAAAAAAGQNASVPPKVIEPVAMPTATATPNMPAAFASTTPQVQKTPTRSKHLFDLFLDFVRTQFPASFVESTINQFLIVGKFGYYAAMGLILIFSLLVAMKTQAYEVIISGVVYFVILAVLQYTGVRFCETLNRLNANTSANISSNTFIDCFALLCLAIGIASLLGCLAIAIAMKEFWLIVPGLAGFIISQFLALIALNPSTIKVSIAPESRAGEEALGVISFLVKAHLKLVPVIFGTFAVLGSVLMLYACIVTFTSAGVIVAEQIAIIARQAMQYSAALPLIAYLFFLLVFLSLDVLRAILVLPSKLDKLQNHEGK